MLTGSNARLCPANGMSCHNYACRQFGCMAVGKPDAREEQPHIVQKGALEGVEEKQL